jgi:hypothetical protein
MTAQAAAWRKTKKMKQQQQQQQAQQYLAVAALYLAG